MKIKQYYWQPRDGWDEQPHSGHIDGPALIIVFGSLAILKKGACLATLREAFPETLIIGCSTAGEIVGTAVTEDCLVATVIAFESARVAGDCISVADYKNSEDAGRAIASNLPQEGLRHIFVLADGFLTNSSKVVRGISDSVSENVTITGGFAGNGMDFSETYVICNNKIEQGALAAIGFYGESLRIGLGSRGGWRPFGAEKLVTASDGNVLFELDGESALDLYKRYLGDDAKNLPASGLLFPLSVRAEGEEPVVRSMLGVNEGNKSMYFAGEVPVGCYARLMRAVADDLIDGAIEAAKISILNNNEEPELAILISCVGRKGVLQQLTEEETEGVEEVYKTSPVMTGFYSYGEIAPFGPGYKSVLHNQTMTITTISED